MSTTCLLAGLKFGKSESFGSIEPIQNNSDFTSLLEALAAECRDLGSGNRSDAEWHLRVGQKLKQYDQKRLLSDVSFSKFKQQMILASGERQSHSLKDSQIESQFSPYQLRYSIWGVKKGTSEPPHAHNNVLSMDKVLIGSARLRQFNRIKDENKHLVIKKSLDEKCLPGSTGLVSDNNNNIHWYDALEDTFVFNISIVNMHPNKKYIKSANKWGGIYLDIDKSIALGGELWRVPTIGYKEATTKYGTGAKINI